MVGRKGMSRWWAVGMSALMALSLAAVTGGAALAQDESAAPGAAAAAECAPVEPTGPLPDLTAQLGHKPKVGLVMKSWPTSSSSRCRPAPRPTPPRTPTSSTSRPWA